MTEEQYVRDVERQLAWESRFEEYDADGDDLEGSGDLEGVPTSGSGEGSRAADPAWASDGAALATGDQGGAAAEGSTPRCVTRGVKSQVGIDWIRAVGPEERLHSIREYLRCFGEPEASKGFNWYSEGQKWSCGIQLLWGSRAKTSAGTLMVEVPGAVLTVLGADGQHRMLRDLLSFDGMYLSRVDVAVDLKNDLGVWLVDNVREACDRGELTGAKTVDPRRPRSGRKLIGNSVLLGRRGSNGSGRYVRVYDKGLETQSREYSQWERWEAEFTGDVAKRVGRLLAEVEEWTRPAVSFALGAVDFRVNNGRRDLDRRPRVEWWEECLNAWLEGIEPKRVKVEPREPRLESTTEWLRRCVAPLVQQLADVADCSFAEVWADLVPTMPNPKKEVYLRPVAWEYLQRLRRRAQRARLREPAVPF